MSAGTDTWHEATLGTTLQPGDTIKTGGSSKAEITFFEGSTIELEASAEIVVSEIGVKDTGSTTIRLTQLLGKTISRVKKLTDSASSYEIETPAAIAAVRGSTMVVTVATDGATVVANEHGDIRVIVDGTEYIIHEGMKRTIIPGQPPGPEVPINPPPSEAGGGGGSSTVLQAKMEVIMLAEPPEAHVGDNITYTYRLHNTGNLPFHNISVSNNVAGNATYQSGDVNANSILNPNETWVFTSTYTVREGDPSPLVATAIISATTSTSVTVVDTETATTSILPEESIPGIAITKTADPLQVHVGDNITYIYTVTNTGNTPLLIISMIDDLIETVTFGGGDSNGDGLLDVGEVWEFTANYTAGVEDPELLENTANVSGRDELSQIVTASDNASVTILRPGIAITKTAEPLEVHVGYNITYTYQVTNTGNTPLANVSVTDNLIPSLTFVSSDINVDEILDVGETWVFSATYTVRNVDAPSLVNIAEVSGWDDLEQEVTASDSESVTILPCN
jgi:uncharacterized repeat protein (TIGR01451 family)